LDFKNNFIRVFVSTSTFSQFSKLPLEQLKCNTNEVILNSLNRKLKKNETSNIIGNFDGIIAGTEIYDEEVLKLAKKLQVISRVGVGLDGIDLDYAKKKGIKVLKTKTTPAPAVAELALGHILDLLRKISFHNNNMKSSNWKKMMGSLLKGKTLGIIGLGSIGKELVKITSSMQLNYLAFDIVKNNQFAKSYGVNYCDLKSLLENSDIVSIHLSLSDENTQMFGLDEFQKMKNSSILINTSRGDVINEHDLEIAIRDGIIAGAGLDVYEKEPYKGSLTGYENVIVTPHIGSYAKEIRETMEIEAVQNLIQVFKES